MITTMCWQFSVRSMVSAYSFLQNMHVTHPEPSVEGQIHCRSCMYVRMTGSLWWHSLFCDLHFPFILWSLTATSSQPLNRWCRFRRLETAPFRGFLSHQRDAAILGLERNFNTKKIPLRTSSCGELGMAFETIAYCITPHPPKCFPEVSEPGRPHSMLLMCSWLINMVHWLNL